MGIHIRNHVNSLSYPFFLYIQEIKQLRHKEQLLQKIYEHLSQWLEFISMKVVQCI